MRCLIVLASGEMRIPDSEQGIEVHRVDWAQAHGSLEMLNGFVGITGILVRPTAAKPSPSRVWVQSEGFLDGCKSEIKLPYQSERGTQHRQYKGIIAIERSRLLREIYCLDPVFSRAGVRM
jgi:hypothetical protein